MPCGWDSCRMDADMGEVLWPLGSVYYTACVREERVFFEPFLSIPLHACQRRGLSRLDAGPSNVARSSARNRFIRISVSSSLG